MTYIVIGLVLLIALFVGISRLISRYDDNIIKITSIVTETVLPSLQPSTIIPNTATPQPRVTPTLASAEFRIGEPVHIRRGPGAEYAVIGYYKPLQIVNVISLDEASDGGIWALTSEGWFNMRCGQFLGGNEDDALDN